MVSTGPKTGHSASRLKDRRRAPRGRWLNVGVAGLPGVCFHFACRVGAAFSRFLSPASVPAEGSFGTQRQAPC